MNRHLRSVPGARRIDSDRAYAMVLTSLILVPLFGFAGFAVDVGAWYSRASALQKAADAAALAGVVWQPDFTTAEAVAQAAATRNGFTNGVNDITVTVLDSGTNSLQVVITDADADLFFSSIFLDDVSIARSAVSEYVVAVPLGSPKNYFGTRELISGSDQEGFSAAINGSCNSRANGGHREVHWLDNSAGNCSGTSSNPDYQGDWAYQYYVTIPASPSPGQVDLFIRDPNYHGASIENGSGYSITTSFRLRAPDSTPFDDTDNPVYTGCLSGSRAGSSGSYTYTTGLDETSDTLVGGNLQSAQWDLFCKIPSGTSGQFILEVGTQAMQNSSGWLNAFGLLAYGHNLGTYTCDTRSSAACPSIVAVEWMSIYANSTTVAEFYLAEIGNEHEGKTLDITLFDPGEGMQAIRIKNPSGSYETFDWTSSGAGSGNNVTSLDVTGSVFNDKFVTLTIDLPTDFDSAYGTTDDWWRIHYTPSSGGNVTDRTTWSVEIRGDPVRLIE